jgi:hypothetical protein
MVEDGTSRPKPSQENYQLTQENPSVRDRQGQKVRL